MSGVRILILSFGMPRGTSLAAALWAAERDLKTPTTGFMVLSLSGRVLIGALGGVGNNQVFAARGGRSRGKRRSEDRRYVTPKAGWRGKLAATNLVGRA